MADERTPFDSIESSLEYIGLLREVIQKTRKEVEANAAELAAGGIGVEGEQRPDLAGGLDRGGREDRPAIGLEDLGHDVGPVVAGELLEDLRGSPGLDLFDRGGNAFAHIRDDRVWRPKTTFDFLEEIHDFLLVFGIEFK